MLNRPRFYIELKHNNLFIMLHQPQVNGIEAIFNEWDSKPEEYKDLRWLAYMLATVYHETGKAMLAVEEWGKGKGHNYSRKVKRSGLPYLIPDVVFYGRGLVQLTWYENYELMGRVLGIDLLNHPELALDSNITVKIMFEGMTKGSSSFGDFTGRSLEQYFNIAKEDPIGARKIINGTDKADLISTYYHTFLDCIS